MNYTIILASQIVFVVVIIFVFYLFRRYELAKLQTQRNQDIEVLKQSFGNLSLQALSEFLKLANDTLSKQLQLAEKELEEKRKLIDKTLQNIETDLKTELQKVQDMVSLLEKDREQKFAQITTQIKFHAEQTAKLQETTTKLQTALANSKVRGQWGERMAEDVLRLAGFIEGINYYKQKVMDTVKNRPDYTFLLPQNLKVNMDVKFPLDNYLRYLEVEEPEKENYKRKFLEDVRKRIKEVTTKEYINPQENTLDYVIVFIPNEQVYAFINQHEPSIIDEAMKNKVILCSPLTLYAILAIIRQAIDNFNLERTTGQILALLGTFYKKWSMFVDSLEKIGKKIEEAQKEYEILTTTRKKQLELSLKQIEQLRLEKSIPETTFNEPVLSETSEPFEEKENSEKENVAAKR